MTREEEIKQIAEEKAHEPSKLMHPYAKQHKTMSAYEIGFIEGAVWADSHPHWISVEDELPEEHTDVLLYDRQENMFVGYRHEMEFSSLIGDDLEIDHNGTITHWMPLPEPPKKGDEQ